MGLSFFIIHHSSFIISSEFGVRRSISPLIVKALRMLLDYAVIQAAFATGVLCYKTVGLGKEDPRVVPYVLLAAFAGALFVSIFQWSGLYGAARSSLGIAEIKRLFNAYLYGCLVLTAVVFFSRVAQTDPPSRLVVLYSLVAGFPALRLERFFLRRLLARVQTNLGDTKTALIVGTSDVARRLHRALQRSTSPRYRVLGFIRSGKRHIEPDEGPVIGGLDEIEAILDERGPAALFIADSMIPHELIFRLHQACRTQGIDFAYLPDLFEFVTRDVKATELDGIPLMAVHRKGRRRMYHACKRVFDVAFSIVLLVGLSPVFGFLAMLVRRGSPGPVFFKQERVGQGGRRFLLYKFRSMHNNAEPYAPSPKSSDDPRITGVGRFLRRHSLDELPQLWNVLRGDMSIVGPRPEMPFIAEKYTPTHRIRLDVKPGLTGVWQISSHRQSGIHDVMDYDLYYVENQSFALDMLVVVETVLYLASGRGGC